MENLSRNLEKTVASFSSPNISKPKKKWDILFVDERGKIVTFPWIKRFSLFLLSLLVISIVTSLMLFFFYARNRKVHVNIDRTVENLQKEMKELRSERDGLLAQLVIFESKNGTRKKEIRKVSKKQTTEPIKREPLITGISTNDQTQQNVKKIDVKDFTVTYNQEKELLRVHFNIRNTSNKRNISGHIFVILKPDNSGREWLSIPSVKLISGKPSEIRRGQYFKIANYKSVKLLARKPNNPETFTNAEIFVFADDREMMTHETIPVKVKVTGRRTKKTESKKVDTKDTVDRKKNGVLKPSETSVNKNQKESDDQNNAQPMPMIPTTTTSSQPEGTAANNNKSTINGQPEESLPDETKPSLKPVQ